MAAARGQAKQQVVTEIFEHVLQNERDTKRKSGNPAVLSLTEAATLLRVSEDDVVQCMQTSSLPGRRIGNAWRFSRDGLLAWLGESDRAGRPTPGFARPTRAD